MKAIFMQNLKKCYLPCMVFQGAAREWIPQGTKPKKRKSQVRERRRSLAESKQTVPKWMVQRNSRMSTVLQMATSQNQDSVTQETDISSMASSRCCPLLLLPSYLRTKYTGGRDPDSSLSLTSPGPCIDKSFSLPHKPGHLRSAEDSCLPLQKESALICCQAAVSLEADKNRVAHSLPT